MSGSTFGNLFRVTTWGESHGKALGAVIDGCPSNFLLDEARMQRYLDRRKPGLLNYTSSRKESDTLHVLSGVMNSITLGTPISCIFYNEDCISSHYDQLKEFYRPGHADASYDYKYGIRDHRGGGRSSGRETIGRVAAGSIAIQILESLGITIHAFTRSIGSVTIPDNEVLSTDTLASKALLSPLFMPDDTCCQMALSLLEDVKKKQDSIGGIIECRINGLAAGIGEPVFDKLDARLSSAVFSIGSVKGVEIGSGMKAALMYGSSHNDSILSSDVNGIRTETNHAGGILGGISNGEEIILRAAIKPTPSIAQLQHTIRKDGTSFDLTIEGRHDTTIVPRAVVVVESMCALTILDLLMEHNSRLFSL